LTRAALEMIGQNGLGYSFDPLTEDGVPHPYSTAAKLLSYVYFQSVFRPFADNRTRPTLTRMVFSRTYFLTTCLKIGTPKFRQFIMNIVPWKNLHTMRDILNVINNTAVEIFEEKKKALEEGDEAVTQQIGKGNDIMSILSAYRLLP
jgi:hypothetical protein